MRVPPALVTTPAELKAEVWRAPSQASEHKSSRPAAAAVRQAGPLHLLPSSRKPAAQARQPSQNSSSDSAFSSRSETM
ncbi:MAG TPA: hypothetical protein DCW72_04145 [Elusimicrobia bacterium]|nr:hypothetical protein [Elusimicrobiota bacterium]